MRRLLQMTHAQWVYRNATAHLEVKEGRTAAAHETILLATMEGFLHSPFRSRATTGRASQPALFRL